MQPLQGQPRKKTGQLIKAYQDRPLKWRDFFWTFIPGVLAVLSPFFYGLQRAQYARANYGPVAAQVWSRPWYILAAIGLIPLLLLAYIRLRRHYRAVAVYKHGLLIKKNRGTYRYFNWSQILGVTSKETADHFLGFRFKNQYQLTVHPANGTPITIDPRIPQQDELSARIKAKIYPRLLQESRAAIKSGTTMDFGLVHMNRHQIRIQEKNYPWDQVKSIEVEKGFLLIEFFDLRIRRIPVGEFKNIEIFLQLIQEGLIA